MPSWREPSWRCLLRRRLLGRRLLGRRLLGGAFFAGAFFAGAFFAGAFFAGAFLAGAFFAGAFFAVDFLAVFFAVVFLVVVFLAGAAAAATRATTGAAVSSTSFGSVLTPETTFFRSWPAVNFGTVVALALMRSPVRGLRTMRALRTLFSKEPKPVMATFSPLATSRVMVSRTDSRAWRAALLLPPNRDDSASIS